MTGAEVLALVGLIADVFGLVKDDVVAFATQRHPELRTDETMGAGLTGMDAARAAALKRVADAAGEGEPK